MLAMALLMLAPTISRVRPMQEASGGGMAAMAATATAPVRSRRPHDPMQRCGYCVIFNHGSLLPYVGVAHLAALLPRMGRPDAPRTPDVARTPRISAEPRGPPLAA